MILASLAVGMCLGARLRVILVSLAVGMCLGARLRVILTSGGDVFRCPIEGDSG